MRQTAKPPWQGSYILTELGTLGGEQAYVYAINNVGQAVGDSALLGSKTHRAFLWSPDAPNGVTGRMVELGTLAGAESAALDINDRGEAVGYEVLAGMPQALYWKDGVMSRLGTLPGHNRSIAWAINNVGQVVGTSKRTDAPADCRAFLWQDGQMRDLDGLPGEQGSGASGINDQGAVVGGWQLSDDSCQGFLWQNGEWVDLGPVGGSPQAHLLINNQGLVVGEYVKDFNQHVFLRQPDGTRVQLPPLPGYGHLVPMGTNNLGQFVGNDFPTIAFYDGVRLEDFGRLFRAQMKRHIDLIWDINDRGQMVGMGTVRSAKGNAILLTPAE